MKEQALKSLIRDIPDFPKPGILFRDITPLLASAPAFRHVVNSIAANAPAEASHVVGIEARGFIFAPAIALALGAAFVPVRKPGKLPYQTHTASYQLEYGSDSLAMHTDAIPAGAQVVIVDDLIATGGTLKATIELVQHCQAEVAQVSCVIELAALGGRQAIDPVELHALLTYP